MDRPLSFRLRTMRWLRSSDYEEKQLRRLNTLNYFGPLMKLLPFSQLVAFKTNSRTP